MKAKMLPALAGVLALSVPSVFAHADDDSKKAARSAEPVQLILSQSEDEPKKPKKPKDEAQPYKEIVAQSEDEPKKPKKPKDEAQPYKEVVAQSDEPKKPKKPKDEAQPSGRSDLQS